MSFGRRYFQEDAQFADSNLVHHDGYVNCNGSNGAVSADTFGPDVTVARTDTGKYTVVCDRAYYQLKSVSVSPVLAATTDITWALDQAGTDLTDTTTFTIQFKTAGSAANLPTGAGFLLRFVHKDIGLPNGV